MAEVELQQIGPYLVSDLLHASSTSAFYRSKQGKKGKKSLLIQRFTRPLTTAEEKKAFLTRAKQLTKLKSSNIIHILDMGFDGDHAYLVMDSHAGKTLQQQVTNGQTLAPDHVRRYLSPIAGALQYAHVSNIVHGNLQPGNLIMGEQNEILLTNFSLTPPGASYELDDFALAIPYMSPEQLQGQITTSSDQYALAVMAYEWLCGRRPYDATERELLQQQQQQIPLPAPRSLKQEISPAVENVITQALSVDPAQRFPHIQAFAEAYLKAMMGFTVPPSAPALVAPRVIPNTTITPLPSVPLSLVPTNQGENSLESGFSNDNRQSNLSNILDRLTNKQTPTVSPEEQPAMPPARAKIIDISRRTQPTESQMDRAESSQENTSEERGQKDDSDHTPAKLLNATKDGHLQAQVTADLCQGGVLSLSLPGYEERPAQVEMASMVSQAITQYVPAVVEAGTGTGKALDVDTPIPTPTGWKRMGDLITGDFVFDEQGSPTPVTAAFDIMYDHKCYEVIFSDGSSLIADAEHEWVSYTCTDRARDLDEQCRDGRTYSLVTTQQMAATLTVHSSARANHAILVAGALTLPEADLPIDPYFLGVWLGDGNSRNNQITTADPDLITEIEKAAYTARSLRSGPYLYAVDDENGKAVSRGQPGMTGRLRALSLVQNKHIPTIYLRTSEHQRRALLAGLLDTDGTISHWGATEFTTTSPQLAQDVYELVCSLGFRPTLREGRARLGGKNCGPKWTLAFTTDQQVFRLGRKILAHKERLRNYNPERNRFRYVVKVQEVPSRPVRCIQVESPSHLYLAGRSMIPTHNSLAYLVPVVRSGQVAIVSTANKALQEQLFYKDIPFVQKYIKPFGAALVKGMGNYICIDRVESERVGIQFYTKNREFHRLVELINDPNPSFNGDIETLGFQLPADIRGKVVTDGDQCAWSKCDYFGDCYVRQMRENAKKSQVIVVNHTLLLLDAAMEGFLLPERDVIILDEAHHLEEEATRCFTISISPVQIQTLLAQRMLKDHSQASLQNEAMRNAQATWILLEQVADPGAKGRANLQAPFEEGLRLATSISDLANSLERQRPKDMPEKETQLYDKLLKRAHNLAENIRTVFSVAQPDQFVYYVERMEGSAARGFVLQASAAPLDVTSWLKERLFNKCNVICTSATLATVGPNPNRPAEKGPNFDYFRQRVGLDAQERSDVLERILPLTFDYESNALLYLPRHLPAPTFGAGSEDYMLAIAREMYKLVKASRGRAFLLFSSKRMLDHAYELISPHLSYPLLKQGDMPRVELTRRFRQEEGAILFGLKSFWEGVDIAGDALSLVVIDKLPFDPPDDPVHEARVNQMKAKNENWFGTYVLPQAVLRLKQGIGRLLRTREDRGVMAILDTRLHTKGYGRLVLDALPPARRTSSLRDIELFFAQT